MSVSIALRKSGNYFCLDVNKTSFVFVNEEMDSRLDSILDFPNHNVILLSKVSAERDIRIQAKSLFILADLHARNGKNSIECSERIVNIGSTIRSKDGNHLVAKVKKTAHTSYFDFDANIRKSFVEAIEEKSSSSLLRDLVMLKKYSTYISSLEVNGKEPQAVDFLALEKNIKLKESDFLNAFNFLGIT